MTRPVLPRPADDGPRMPASVLRRRPAQILPTPAPRQRNRRATATAELRSPPPIHPAPPPIHPARPPIHPARPRRVFTRPRRAPAPRPVHGRRQVPIGLLAAALVFIGLFGVAMGLGAATNFDLSDLFRGPDEAPPHAFPVLEPSRPVRLTIPSIKVQAPILDVGWAKDGTVDVPPLNRHQEAGWFDEGPTPGQFGPALIVGHADTRSGPSIFFNLGKVRPGQKIEVLREDHTVAVFKVNSVEHFGKTKLPIQRVYGDFSRPSLRLITCGGTWLGGSQGYSDNVIVFASLVASTQA